MCVDKFLWAGINISCFYFWICCFGRSSQPGSFEATVTSIGDRWKKMILDQLWNSRREKLFSFCFETLFSCNDLPCATKSYNTEFCLNQWLGLTNSIISAVSGHAFPKCYNCFHNYCSQLVIHILFCYDSWVWCGHSSFKVIALCIKIVFQKSYINLFAVWFLHCFLVIWCCIFLYMYFFSFFAKVSLSSSQI